MCLLWICHQNSRQYIENLGTPINSTQDDFSFVIDAENKKGFVTSNREGLGSDDIYRFNKFPVPVCNQALQGVMDQDTGLVWQMLKVCSISI
jgi:hypothetical protein